MKDFAAKLKNSITRAVFEKRLDDDKIRIKTVFGRVIEKEESYPYGIYAKAKKGDVTVLCPGGNLDALRILPIESTEGAPELKDGDFCIYSLGGSFVVCRDDGSVEVNGRQNGGMIKVDELKTQLNKATARIDGIINALKNSPTIPQDGGASFKAAIVAALSALIDTENYGSLASDKVFHGTGQN